MATKTTEPKRKPTAHRKRKAADPAQFERFVETARKIGVDEDPETLDRAFAKVVPPKSS
jgi:hypothetical protein